MRSKVALICCLAVYCTRIGLAKQPRGDNDSEQEALVFLAENNAEKQVLFNDYLLARWGYSTNLTDHNAEVAQASKVRYTRFEAESVANASTFDSSNMSPDIQRRLSKILSDLALPEALEVELDRTVSKMGKIYSTTEVCVPTKGCYKMSDLSSTIKDSTDYEELEFIWEEWRRSVGQKIKPLYERYVVLKNTRARQNGYEDCGDQWRSSYEAENFTQDMQSLYAQIEPLYKELHAYVRRNLYNLYGPEHISLTGKLPANVLGDMWGRFWNNIYKHMIPYPEKPSIDPSDEMLAQNYTVEKMFATADDFYASMGLLRVPNMFYERSMIRKPEDGREVICHATAWDMYDQKDFRIKMCTKDYDFEHLNIIHHELGHTQYQQQYKDQPVDYRHGGNGGFHEAIGELMAMAASTPKHLYSIGLMDELVEDYEIDINFLLSQSLITISTLPFHLVNDLWRWEIFAGGVPVSEWNNRFWEMKENILGVEAPVNRTSADLDPPALFHICQDYDMIRYYTRTILQFQFNEKLCQVSGHSGPIHRCDFSGNTEVGNTLARMLKLGSSVPWQDALEAFNGEREMNAGPILRYFEPLYDWLKVQNAKNGDVPGWN